MLPLTDKKLDEMVQVESELELITNQTIEECVFSQLALSGREIFHDGEYEDMYTAEVNRRNAIMIKANEFGLIPPTAPKKDKSESDKSESDETKPDKSESDKSESDKSKSDESKGSKKAHKVLGLNSKRNAFAIKCYAEQLPMGEKCFIERVKFIQKYFKYEIWVLAIKHYKDTVTDGFWLWATEKPHYHIIVKFADYKVSQRIKKVLDILGIVFREGTDDSLIKNHGIESISCWEGYVVYLTHETDDAIADGKEIYDHSEIVSNLSEEQIQVFRDKYFGAKRVKPKEMADLDHEAFTLGYALGDFDKWYGDLLYDARKKSEIRTIRESYFRGVTKYVEEHNEVLRLCVFIQGKRDVGKTYNTQKALEQLFPKDLIYHVKHGGSGQFDRFQSNMRAIVVDDFGLSNLLNKTDNYACQLEKRYSDNPWWVGTHLVVTSNYSFPEWLEEKCGFHTTTKDGRVAETYNAILSRFYVCHIAINEKGVNELVLDSPSTRGTLEDIKQRDLMFQEFQTNFNLSISAYTPCVKEQPQDIAVSDWALTREEIEKFRAYISNYVDLKISENEELSSLHTAYEKAVADEREKEKMLSENSQSDWDSCYVEIDKLKQETVLAWNNYSAKLNQVKASALTELQSKLKFNYKRVLPAQ